MVSIKSDLSELADDMIWGASTKAYDFKMNQ